MSRTTCGPGTVVAAVDGSPALIAALRYARSLSRDLRLRLVAVIATDDREPWDWSHPYQGYDPLDDAARHLDTVVDDAFDGEFQADIGKLALRGRAVDAITSYASDAALLAVGSRGRRPLLGALLGSVAAGCARASCPVVVVHAERSEPSPAAAHAEVVGAS